MSSAAPRKRRTTGSTLVSRPGTKTRRAAAASRTANASRVASRTASAAGPAPPTETIDVMDGVEEVVDLTCEGSESAVVDLTNNDSVLVVGEGKTRFFGVDEHSDQVCAGAGQHLCRSPSGPQSGSAPPGQSYVVSSDEEEDTPPVNAALLASAHSSSSSRSTPGTISCPVCLDSYSEIVESRRLVVSTRCGHVFCSQCLRDALTSSHTCPTCRKKLTPRQYHPLYV